MRQEDLPKANANCVVCGKPYYRCESCIKLRNQGIISWRLYCDTSMCFNVYSIFESYKRGIETKEDIRRIIFENDNIPNLTEEYKSILNEILFDKVEDISEEKPVVVEEKPETVVNKDNQVSKGKNQWKKKQNVK